MRNQENIVSYTPEEMLELSRRGDDDTDWERVNSMSEAEIERLAAEDMKEHGFSAETYKHGLFTTEPLVQRMSAVETIVVEAIEDDHQGTLLILHNALGQYYHRILGTTNYVRVQTKGSMALAT